MRHTPVDVLTVMDEVIGTIDPISPEHREWIDRVCAARCAVDEMLKELEDILDWALVEKSPLRSKEIASIKKIIARATGEKA